MIIHFLKKSELGSSASKSTKHDTDNARAWKHIRRGLELRLGIVQQDDFVDADDKRHRHDSKSHRSDDMLLRARLVANTRVADDRKLTGEELLKRYTRMPFLKDNLVLEEGDVLVVECVPVHIALIRKLGQHAHVGRDNIRNVLKRNEFEEAKQELPHLIRHFETIAEEPDQNNVEFDENMTEEEKIMAIINHAHESHGTKKKQRPRKRKREPPTNYVCARCNVPGHWVQDCPTLGDERFDRAKPLSTNRIAKTLLVPIDVAPTDPNAIYYVDQNGKMFVRGPNALKTVKPHSGFLCRDDVAAFILEPILRDIEAIEARK